MANNAKMTNLQALLSAGINPKNGLPYRNDTSLMAILH